MKRFCLGLLSQSLCPLFVRRMLTYDMGRDMIEIFLTSSPHSRLVLLSSLVSIIHCVSVAQTISLKMRKTNELQLLFSSQSIPNVQWNKMSHFISQLFRSFLRLVFFFLVIENWKVSRFEVDNMTTWDDDVQDIVWLIEPQKWIAIHRRRFLRWF